MTNPKPKPVKEPHKKKRRKKPERKILVDQLDDIVSLIVRKRDGGCVTPGTCWGHATNSHYYKRENWGIRWSLINCNCQCQGHNNAHNNHEYKYAQYMRSHYGPEVFDKLLEEEKQYRERNQNWQIWELRDMLEKFTKMYEEMK